MQRWDQQRGVSQRRSTTSARSENTQRRREETHCPGRSQAHGILKQRRIGRRYSRVERVRRRLAAEVAQDVQRTLFGLLDEVICALAPRQLRARAGTGGEGRTDVERERDDHDDNAPGEEEHGDVAQAAVARVGRVLEEREDCVTPVSSTQRMYTRWAGSASRRDEEGANTHRKRMGE